jgi:2-oxoglutarate ferredoxin oxidoreductase subunit alpha
MMEGIVLPPEKNPADLPKRDWTAGNMKGRKARHITSINLVPAELEAKIKDRFVRYEAVKKSEIRFEEVDTAGADLVLAAYGTCARVGLGAKKLAEKAGIKVGLFRPITLWPFPYDALGKIGESGKPILTVEMSMGQMIEDVRLSVLGKAPIHFLGHTGGIIPTEEEVFEEIKKLLGK